MDNLFQEIWKDVKNYEGYYVVSNLGNVKGVERKTPHNCIRKERLLKFSQGHNGYYHVTLFKNNVRESFLVHHLVFDAFIGTGRAGLCIDHINNNKKDNTAKNLQLLTHRENTIKRSLHNPKRKTKYLGVYQYGTNGKYQAHIKIDGKNKHLGVFRTPEEAQLAYSKRLAEITI